MEVLGRLIGLLALLLTGTGLRSTGVLNESRTARLNAVAYYVALPALVFAATYDRSVADLLTPALLVGLLAVMLGTAALAGLVHRNLPSRPRRSVAIVQ